MEPEQCQAAFHVQMTETSQEADISNVAATEPAAMATQIPMPPLGGSYLTAQLAGRAPPPSEQPQRWFGLHYGRI